MNTLWKPIYTGKPLRQYPSSVEGNIIHYRGFICSFTGWKRSSLRPASSSDEGSRSQRGAATSALKGSRVWPALPLGLSDRIANNISRNEVAGTLRLVNRAAAPHFLGPQHATIRLSQPVPLHAFAHKWGTPGATRGLSLRQRRRLLCLTAASGVIPDMEVALEAAGCLLSEDVFAAAAGAGQLEMCKWLLKRDCPADCSAAKAAVAAGHLHVCEWLQLTLQQQPDCAAAAKGGHADLMERLVKKSTGRPMLDLAMRGVAAGCDLATLQQLHLKWFGRPDGDAGDAEERRGKVSEYDKRVIMGAAAGSPTPDWQAKVEWLEGQGYPRTEEACAKAAKREDAVSRLQWLRQRGYPLTEDAAVKAAAVGGLGTLQYLHEHGVEAAGAVTRAAEAGHLPVVAWLVEAPGVAAPLDCDLFNAAARSGSLELLQWLRERGCPWDEGTIMHAATGGNDAALEWLVEQGCPMPGNAVDEDSPYAAAANNNDLSTLHCLRRLGCPWGTDASQLFASIICAGMARAPTVRLLLEAGCAVNWYGMEMQAADFLLLINAYRPDRVAVMRLLRKYRSGLPLDDS